MQPGTASVEFIMFSKEDSEKFKALVNQEVLNSVKELGFDAKGLPRTEMNQEAQKVVQKYNKR